MYCRLIKIDQAQTSTWMNIFSELLTIMNKNGRISESVMIGVCAAAVASARAHILRPGDVNFPAWISMQSRMCKIMCRENMLTELCPPFCSNERSRAVVRIITTVAQFAAKNQPFLERKTVSLVFHMLGKVCEQTGQKALARQAYRDAIHVWPIDMASMACLLNMDTDGVRQPNAFLVPEFTEGTVKFKSILITSQSTNRVSDQGFLFDLTAMCSAERLTALPKVPSRSSRPKGANDAFLHQLTAQTFCRLYPSGREQLRGMTVKAIQKITAGTTPFQGRPLEAVTLEPRDLRRLRPEIRTLVKEHFTPDKKGNYGVPAGGFNMINISFYINHTVDRSLVNMKEVTAGDDDGFTELVASRDIAIDEELYLEMEPFDGVFDESSREVVTNTLETLKRTKCFLKPSGVAGIGVYALVNMPEGCRPFPDQPEYSDICLTLGEVESLPPPITRMIRDYFVMTPDNLFPVISGGLNDLDMTFFLNSQIGDARNLQKIDSEEGTYVDFSCNRRVKAGEELFDDYELPPDQMPQFQKQWQAMKPGIATAVNATAKQLERIIRADDDCDCDVFDSDGDCDGDNGGGCAMTTWRHLDAGACVRIIDDVAEAERLCNSAAPGAIELTPVGWSEQLKAMCGNEYIVSTSDSADRSYALRAANGTGDVLASLPFNTCVLLERTSAMLHSANPRGANIQGTGSCVVVPGPSIAESLRKDESAPEVIQACDQFERLFCEKIGEAGAGFDPTVRDTMDDTEELALGDEVECHSLQSTALNGARGVLTAQMHTGVNAGRWAVGGLPDCIEPVAIRAKNLRLIRAASVSPAILIFPPTSTKGGSNPARACCDIGAGCCHRWWGGCHAPARERSSPVHQPRRVKMGLRG